MRKVMRQLYIWMNFINEGINLLEVLWTNIITMQKMPLLIYTGFGSHWTVLNGENIHEAYTLAG